MSDRLSELKKECLQCTVPGPSCRFCNIRQEIEDATGETWTEDGDE